MTEAGLIKDKYCVNSFVGSLFNVKYEGQGTLQNLQYNYNTEHYAGEFVDGNYHG